MKIIELEKTRQFTKKINMGRFFLALILFLFCAQFGFSQNQNTTNEEGITEGPLIKDMMDRFVEINKANSTLEGWRIQLLATTDRQKMESTRQNFQ